ncbi:unnamed protein product [Amoebophrya sp. A120]|nr:unnamed protein product [Amoebophrya sp. A120]|eukprot:GSA120T00016711001.1
MLARPADGISCVDGSVESFFRGTVYGSLFSAVMMPPGASTTSLGLARSSTSLDPPIRLPREGSSSSSTFARVTPTPSAHVPAASTINPTTGTAAPTAAVSSTTTRLHVVAQDALEHGNRLPTAASRTRSYLALQRVRPSIHFAKRISRHGLGFGFWAFAANFATCTLEREWGHVVPFPLNAIVAGAFSGAVTGMALLETPRRVALYAAGSAALLTGLDLPAFLADAMLAGEVENYEDNATHGDISFSTTVTSKVVTGVKDAVERREGRHNPD